MPRACAARASSSRARSRWRASTMPREARYCHGNVECIDLKLIPADLPFGKTSAIAGEAAFRYIERAVRIVEAGRGAGDLHGAAQQGSAACRGPQVSGPHRTARGAHRHARSLDDAGRAETARHPRDHAYRAARRHRAHRCRRWWSASLVARTRRWCARASRNPRIGVCGINPHAGENGLFGRGEEAAKIDPGGARHARARGWNVRVRCRRTRCSSSRRAATTTSWSPCITTRVMGPSRCSASKSGVNITVGLPVVRTSVDHGTAFDIAGKGVADERSLIEALRQAAELARR